MNARTLLLLIVVLLLVTLYRPRGAWREFKRLWGQREYIVKVIATVVGIYFLYGLFTMYQRGMWSWEWWQ
jgi:hypothetical protein